MGIHFASEHLERKVVGTKKRVLSAAGRAAIVKAAKKRWADKEAVLHTFPVNALTILHICLTNSEQRKLMNFGQELN